MNSQQAHEKILNTVNHEGNANGKHSEIPLPVPRVALIKKTDIPVLMRMRKNWDPCVLLV